ncbi:MAG: hypothetical protein A3C85_03600 [Candidatus Doudnabacteria bacterium RIFCSPHIGHO2_02_FULL_48_21]|uniref:Nitroreductase domain-containing protein n=1 Tax=Candidatus Doudnabacteria bacterium RIFCSPLOWO2_02_FULL_48_13 TaxID=1817845 RepID=A0A1F5QC58_9BACT|nr:MAG: hypothetical protein A3K05_01980 [Candidatus Doudnabacteria bacterium RIFCSPHIGHO2_01_48_18]OGE91244.1 MAG: hypothetical protein A3F44_02750 [Candidatus Doudnabacteria bacterium RIFCSPHIGHO2_12_FULL_47_25]OGE93694.1 MAG: hypothetical protein A3C85_03600 [Candidatus Doudnabacteria bacterium RIFCSPHIGHO2_02_FULL_48_21]OGE99791.1 MAG: hypothetical protein A3J05_00780 [Candidatus Doudnabacteria bacterium RIFCSPLOWO2_02_FULL_48_13]OGF00647.1 MAG: hypothetical protein A3G07_04510 [Candidatus 
MENIIEKIINLAIQAPSGENCQPWRFEIGNNEIDIYNVPERDQSLYNTNQAGSYVAHGALVENMIISAKTLSYSASITLFPKSSEPDLVASITLRQSAPQEDSLLDSIAKRTTNRKPYMKTQLPTEQLERLAATSSQVDGAKAEFVTDPDKIKALAEACSVNEIVMFSNNTLHNFFFNHINWTQEEETKKRFGFYVKTLELPPPAQLGMKMFKNWPLMNLLNKFGFAKLIAKGNAKIYAACSAMGAIAVPDNDKNNLIAAGRSFQRLWLQATQMGLSIQPLTGVLFLMKAITNGRASKFSDKQIELIKQAYKQICEIFYFPDKKIALLFRIGRGDNPSAHSLKLPAKITKKI